jgi:hypothetical protein
MSALGSDLEGTYYDKKTWKYSSIVGMLIYVCTNTIPDISFAVSQVAKYCKSPKPIHATAVKTIICYLKRMSEKGIYVNFTGKLDMVDWVDCSGVNRIQEIWTAQGHDVDTLSCLEESLFTVGQC